MLSQVDQLSELLIDFCGLFQDISHDERWCSQQLSSFLPLSFSLSGAVAQLGERLNGIQEVVGSIPIGSTIQFITYLNLPSAAFWISRC